MERKIYSFSFLSYHLSLPQEAESELKAGKARFDEVLFSDTLPAPTCNRTNRFSLQRSVTKSFQSEWYLKAVVGSPMTYLLSESAASLSGPT